MAFLRIPLVGSLINRSESPIAETGDQLFVNCYPEINRNPVTGTSRVYLMKRPGSTKSAITTASNICKSGCVVWTGNTAASPPVVFSFYKTSAVAIQFFDETVTQIGGNLNIYTDCLSLTETMISTTANLVAYVVASATIAAWFFPQGGAWTQITDADFPPNLGTPEPIATGSGPAHMDGYMFVMTKNGKIWNSDLNSVANWTANSYITDQSYPDGGVGVARYKNLIVAFGKYSISFYQNTGNATGSPLTIIASATSRIGAFTGGQGDFVSIRSVGENIFFIGTEFDSGRRAIYKLNGYSPQKISNAFIDKFLNDPSASYGISMGLVGVLTMHGMTHLLLATNSGGAGFSYCIETDMWWKVGGGGAISAIVAATGIASNSYFTTLGVSNTDCIFKIVGSAYTDNAVAYTQTVQTELLDMGTMSKKVITRVRVVGDIQSSASAVTVSYSDDDYATFTTLGTIDMSDAAAVANGLTRAGTTRRRAWKLQHSANTPLRLEALELEYSVEAGT